MTAAASRALGWLDRFPYAVLAAVLRLAVAIQARASGEDSWALCIAHAQRNKANNATIDLVREWRPPFSAEAVISEICDLCRQYRCYKITSDRTGKWSEERLQGESFDPIRIVWGLCGFWSLQNGLHRLAGSLLCGYTHIAAITNMSPWGFKR